MAVRSPIHRSRRNIPRTTGRNIGLGRLIVKHHGSEVTAAVEAWLETRLNRAAEHLKAVVVREVSVPGVPGDRRSLPGEYPRIDLTHPPSDPHLYRSYRVTRPGRLLRQVESTVRHSIFLELGLPDGSVRKHLTRALEEQKGRLIDILTEPMPET